MQLRYKSIHLFAKCIGDSYSILPSWWRKIICCLIYGFIAVRGLTDVYRMLLLSMMEHSTSMFIASSVQTKCVEKSSNKSRSFLKKNDLLVKVNQAIFSTVVLCSLCSFLSIWLNKHQQFPGSFRTHSCKLFIKLVQIGENLLRLGVHHLTNRSRLGMVI